MKKTNKDNIFLWCNNCNRDTYQNLKYDTCLDKTYLKCRYCHYHCGVIVHRDLTNTEKKRFER